MIKMPGQSYSGALPALSERQRQLSKRLQQHVVMLADTIGERNIWHYAELKAASQYLEEELKGLGYSVSDQKYEVRGKTVRNIEAEQLGKTRPEEIIVIGAHYDSVIGSPGANDNATGVAAMLELARLLRNQKPDRTIRFVAFVNEEPPFYRTSEMGSRVYASRSRKQNEKIIGMLSLETIGCYSDRTGSQHYPPPFSFFYPDTANFIGFVSNISSRDLLHQTIKAFRQHTKFPSEGVAAPGWMTGIGWSDHWSFWKEGYPAIMVSDTALFRYAHYHSTQDTPDKIDYDRLARVVQGLAKTIVEIAGTRPEIQTD